MKNKIFFFVIFAALLAAIIYLTKDTLSLAYQNNVNNDVVNFSTPEPKDRIELIEIKSGSTFGQLMASSSLEAFVVNGL